MCGFDRTPPHDFLQPPRNPLHLVNNLQLPTRCSRLNLPNPQKCKDPELLIQRNASGITNPDRATLSANSDETRHGFRRPAASDLVATTQARYASQAERVATSHHLAFDRSAPGRA
jgi:hypothetical protein